MSTDWDMAIGVYLAVGAVLLLVIYGHHRLTRVERSDWVQAALRASDPERHTLGYRVMADFVAPALAAVFIWALWPAALAMAATWKWKAWKEEQHLKARKDAQDNQEPVEMRELIERLSIESIEARETVHDPLQAAPATPFGHLGAAWVAFRSQLQPQDELWSFVAVRADEWGFQEETGGYAAVRDGAIAAYFTSRRKKAGK